MATRYSGDLTLFVEFDDRHDEYRVRLQPKSRSGVKGKTLHVGPPKSLPAAVDSPEMIDSAARAAISFAPEGLQALATMDENGTGWQIRRPSAKSRRASAKAKKNPARRVSAKKSPSPAKTAPASKKKAPARKKRAPAKKKKAPARKKRAPDKRRGRAPVRRNQSVPQDLKILGTTGDADPFEYGGGVVYESKEGYVTWEFWDGLDVIAPDAWGEEGDRVEVEVYRAKVPEDVFAYYDWASPEETARYTGADPEDLEESGRSPDPMIRVRALEAIRDAWGPTNLDAYPSVMTFGELRERWEGALSRRNPPSHRPRRPKRPVGPRASRGGRRNSAGRRSGERGEVVAGAARAMFVSAWADEQESRGVRLGPVELMDVAPPEGDPAATRAAEALVDDVEHVNAKSIEDLLSRAAMADGGDVDPEEFGHYLAMQAMGHGVSWFDDHAWFPLRVPHAEFTEAHLEGESPDPGHRRHNPAPRRYRRRNPCGCDHRRNPGEHARRLAHDLTHRLSLHPADARDLARRMTAAEGHLAQARKILEQASEVVGGMGVEPVADAGRTVLIYVNVGDPYDTTLYYDAVHEHFSVGSWGEWIEAYERKGGRVA